VCVRRPRCTVVALRRASIVFDLSTMWTIWLASNSFLARQLFFDNGLCFTQRSETTIHALLVIEDARHPHSVDAAEDALADADRQSDGASVRPDLTTLAKAVAASPRGSDQARCLSRVTRKRVIRVARAGKKAKQRRSLLGWSERDTG